ncbi:hypothetical protein HU200_043041 [Digitaria exilis]|uniref:RNase H type-1 domain-containing protein n=1 Tax=Digitaria exilis TaxID=1010633 RepID=A0A835BC31_9POAL|nr:hypothetical protein HU200_043041 [Digitaria exilis]
MDSVHFLLALQASLAQVRQGELEGAGKGKQPCCSSGNSRRKKQVQSKEGSSARWKPPPPGHYKVNVDGSFVAQTGEAGVGVIRVLFRCSDAVEAEAQACAEGLRLAAQWVQGPVILESDCARVVGALQKKEDRSSVARVKRECNLVANDLAHLARRNMHPAVWLGQAPVCVVDLIKSDCNYISP